MQGSVPSAVNITLNQMPKQLNQQFKGRKRLLFYAEAEVVVNKQNNGI